MMNGYGMGLLWLWTLLVVVGVIAVVWGLARATSARPTPPSGPSGQERARDILRERFARGEITEQELRERMRVLDDH